MVERTEIYLREKFLEIISVGVSVLLSRGFWKKSERKLFQISLRQKIFLSSGIISL
jgi:hypothetical protein